MAQYGVGTANPFDALDEDAVAKQAAAAKAPEAPKPAAAAQPKAPAQSRTLDAPNKRGGAFPRGFGRGGRGRGRGNRDPKRMFERHSGTGRGKEVRKGGYGGYDAAGTMQDDMKAAEVATELTLEDAKPAGAFPAAGAPGGAVVPAAGAAVEQPKVETEEEKKEREDAEKEAAREAAFLSFDQFKEQQKAKAVEDDLKLQTRQVEIDEKKFKACKALEKDDDNGYADILGSSGDDSDNKKKGEKKTKKTKHLDEVLKELPGGPAPAPRPAYAGGDFRGGRGGFGPRGGRGRGFGGRGGPRGGFGRGGGRGAPPMQPVDVKSDADFPKLGK